MKATNIRALFIDDSLTQNRLSALTIDVLNLPVNAHFNQSALEALDYLAELKDSQFPEIIFVDINMPILNGYEFSQQYQNMYASKFPDTLLVFLSSAEDPDFEKRSANLKIPNLFHLKPLDHNLFEKLLDQKRKSA